MDGRSPPWRVRYALGFLCPPKLELHTTALFRVLGLGWMVEEHQGERRRLHTTTHVRTVSGTGPPRGKRVGISSTVFGIRGVRALIARAQG